jgi:DNA-binding PadR family transcriptional regulator
MKARPSPEDFLPLNPPQYYILLALGPDTKHGYAMMEELQERTSGRVTLLPGTLYTNMARLLEEELVEEVDGPDYEVRGGKRRFYRVTDLGRAVARAESRRLATVLDVARAAGYLAAEEGAS